MNLSPIVALIVLAVSVVPASAATYDIDAAHSSVSFKIRHLASKVRGRFDKFSGTVDYDAGKPESWRTQTQIDPGSIDTGVSKRDDHLRSGDFFDVAKCGEMSFKSTKVTDVKGSSAKLHGELTMHCVTKPVVLDLEIGGETKDPMGTMRLGATATGTLNRKDWGLSWNKALEAGSMLVGEDVAFEIEVEAVPAKAAAEKGKESRKEAAPAKR